MVGMDTFIFGRCLVGFDGASLAASTPFQSAPERWSEGAWSTV